MLSKAFQLCLSGLGLGLIFGNSVAFAQVVVPTVPSGSGTVSSGSSIPAPNSTNIDSATRFSCQFYNGQYTVMYQPESQPGQFFPWAAPAALGDGWTPQKRCQAIASRLELYRPDGLQELQIAVENRENVICVTTEANSACRIVVTVPRGKDPYTIRTNIFQNLATADNGQQTIAVNTYTNRGSGAVGELYNLGRTFGINGNSRVSSSNRGINLKPFLDPKDGGTAKNLRNGVSFGGQSQPSNQGNFRLNSDQFRK
ncbi:COP23 domain-containing protein [Cronbergia sp. UHCC 0137]|uniref:COP23 domain-containing protein n=1 Tax=Cronbergia sp. UHCC 0137 TaxID=3110239 RepID=UPI002B217A3F|nr:COP23 domain-containing protein [Cronbergia sp. UHCC 0137]MEA5617102.1 COP23 domain-containing protein [Cronbergia sp. UHCC 0137]